VAVGLTGGLAGAVGSGDKGGLAAGGIGGAVAGIIYSTKTQKPQPTGLF